METSCDSEGRILLSAMPQAPDPRRGPAARRLPPAATRAEHPEAVAIIEADWDALTTFYDFPEEHWKHIRTTNVVESPFAALRLRTGAAKRFKKVASATTLI